MSQRSYSLASHQICTLRRQFVQTPGLPFSDLLSAERVEQVLEDEKVMFRDRVFSPLVTIWVFLSQVLSSDHCCREAVARLLAYRVASGLPSCSPLTGSYCKARQRLSENVLARLVRTTGQELDRQTPSAWLWKGPSVKIADGTVVSMPDTPANQREYPQQKRQAPGVGFPLARLVALISLSCGVVLDLAVAPYHGKEKGETALFRSLWNRLQPGDVALGDRFYGSYLHLALLYERGVYSVFRLHSNSASSHAAASIFTAVNVSARTTMS